MDRSLTGREVHFEPDELIVSKTDPRGIITYANNIFCKVSGFTEDELLGRPHSIIRHPDMPKCAFKLVWQMIRSGQECFAYVVNRSKNGDHYWVLAHITPMLNETGDIIGYHSSRRVPEPQAVNAIIPLYKSLCQIESQIGGTQGMDAAYEKLTEILSDKGVPYDQFVMSLA